MGKGKYPLGDAKARQAARKQRKVQRAAVRQAGGGKPRKTTGTAGS